MESENNYQALVNAAQSLVLPESPEEEGHDVRKLTDEQRATSLDLNRSALNAAREALAGPCHVPLEYSEEFSAAHFDDLVLFPELARSFRLEVENAGQTGELKTAAGAGVDILNLANATRKGGLVTDLLVAIAIHGIGIAALRELQNKWTADEAVGLVAELLRADADHEPFLDIVRRNQDWEAKVWPEGEDPDMDEEALKDAFQDCKDIDPEQHEAFVGMVKAWFELPQDSKSAIYKWSDDRESGMTRLLAVDLALGAYRETHGRYPKTLSELVPRFIAEVPPDPVDGEPLRYRRRGRQFLLYGLGAGGVDLGGKVGNALATECGDANLTLEMLDMEDGSESGCACDGSARSLVGRLGAFFRRLGFGR